MPKDFLFYFIHISEPSWGSHVFLQEKERKQKIVSFQKNTLIWVGVYIWKVLSSPKTFQKNKLIYVIKVWSAPFILKFKRRKHMLTKTYKWYLCLFLKELEKFCHLPKLCPNLVATLTNLGIKHLLIKDRFWWITGWGQSDDLF